MKFPPLSRGYSSADDVNLSHRQISADDTRILGQHRNNSHSSLPELGRAKESGGQVMHSGPQGSFSTQAPMEKQLVHSQVRFGGEELDLNKEEAISLETFQVLMNKEPNKPFFAFARSNSSNGGLNYRHLYSAENVIDWYPHKGNVDPCTHEAIEKIEYFLYFKGQSEAIHVGDVHSSQIGPESKTADYLIWSFTGEDEPSKMMALLAMAYLQKLDLSSITSDDTLDTSNISNLDPKKVRDLKQQVIDSSNASKIVNYVAMHISDLVDRGELKCSDPNALLMSIQHDAAQHLAGILVSQDPSLDEDNDDFAKLPHIRTNALTMKIMKLFTSDSGFIQNEM